MTIKWPNDTQHMLELGRTGSGKTVAGLWHLSYANFDKKPWVIFDTKGDEVIAQIGKMDGVKHIKLNEPIEKVGLHIVRPTPNQVEEIDEFMWRIHQRNNVGVFIDEGFSVGKPDGLNALLTQGRSKHIPVIVLSQRPSSLSRFCFSESSFFQVFALTDRRDRKTVQEFIPVEQFDLETRLPPYYSVWYDVKSDQVTTLEPVPPAQDVLTTFRDRLQVKRNRL